MNGENVLQIATLHIGDEYLLGEIQSRLNAEGFNPGKIDGIYGPKTATAVSAFQAARGLVADAETGAETAAALGVELS